MPIIQFTPQQPTKEEKLAKFFADQELQDFQDMFAVFREQCQAGFLFHDLDFRAIYDSIINNIKSKHFDADDKLNKRSERDIYEFYDMHLNIDEIYEELERRNK